MQRRKWGKVGEAGWLGGGKDVERMGGKNGWLLEGGWVGGGKYTCGFVKDETVNLMGGNDGWVGRGMGGQMGSL